METIWKDISEYEGIYQISNHGKIRRIKPEKNTYVGKLIRPIKINGYFFVNLYKNGKRKPHKVHKLVAQEFLGLRPDGMQINHMDGDKSNNVVENLEYLTPKENCYHARKILGISQIGSRSPNHKLTETDVVKIKEIIKEKILTDYGIGNYFNVSTGTIFNIRHGITWSHVLCP